jgi:hypothetical protein
VEIDKRKEEQRDWKGYGSAEHPAVVTYYHAEDDHGVHLLLSMNDRAMRDFFGDQSTFERHLAARYRNALLAQISSAIFDRVAPLVAGTLTQGGPAELAPMDEGFMWLRLMPHEMGRLLGSSPAEADLAAAVALFPAGVLR